MRFPGERPRWGFIHILLIPAAVMGLQFLYAFFGPDLFSYLVYKAGLPMTPVYDFAWSYLLYFLFFMAAIGLVLLITRSNLSSVGFRGDNIGKILAWGVSGGLGLFVTVLAFGYIIQLLAPELQPQPFEDALRNAAGIGELLVMILVGSVMAPLVEEVYFRGMVYPVLRRHLGIIWAIVLSGVFFGLLHWDFWRTVPLAAGGMALAYIYERSRTIYAPWLAHGVWNGVMALLVFFGQP